MRYLILILFALITTVTIYNTHAQDATPEPIPIVERCLIDLREPPPEWTFEGTIVTFRGGDGVHGFRSDFSSRYYIAFDSESEFSSSGSFSPDGQWFATYGGSTSTSATQDYFSASYLRVVSTRPNDKTHLISYGWYGYESAVATADFDPPRWLDSQNLVVYGFTANGSDVGWYRYNTFTSEINPVDDALVEQLANGYANQPVLSILIREQLLTPDDSRFPQPLFLMRDETSTRFYITDEKTAQIYDTCLESRRGFALSPTGDQVAVSIGDFVYILDLDEWVGYRLNLAANDVVGWFADLVS